VSQQENPESGQREQEVLAVVTRIEAHDLSEWCGLIEEMKKSEKKRSLLSDNRVFDALTSLYESLPILRPADRSSAHKKEVNLKVDIFSQLISSGNNGAEEFFQKVLNGADPVMKRIAQYDQEKFGLFGKSVEDTSRNLLVGADFSAGSPGLLKTFVTYLFEIPIPGVKLKLFSEVRRQREYLLQDSSGQRRKTIRDALIAEYGKEREVYIKLEIIGLVTLLGEKNLDAITFFREIANNETDALLKTAAQDAIYIIDDSSVGVKKKR